MGAVPAGAVLEIDALWKSFSALPIIRGLTLQVVEGERHAIIGPNGAGKSTLFHLISGRLPPSSGRIRLRGADIAGLRPYQINRRGLARSFQVTNIFPRLSVYENVRCAVLSARGHDYTLWRRVDRLQPVRERTAEVIAQIGLAARCDVAAGVLSYAEQRALEIGIAIAGDCSVLLLDEPTAGMSRPETEHAVQLIRTVTRGKTLLMVEHDMGVVFGLADRISVLVHGEIIATDTPEKIRMNAEVQCAYLGQPGDADTNPGGSVANKATICS
jgi:branched-chain amino acid transport system ATP-binding protein